MENGKETGAAAEYRARRDSFDALIGVGENFDIVRKTLLVGGVRKGVYYYLNAFGNGEITEKLMEYLVSGSAGRALEDQPENFIQYFPYAEASHGEDEGQAQYLLMSGNAVLIIEGIPGYIIIDTRKYPSRGMQEPEKDKVLRGSRDGFVEALVPNVGLLRRRIRDPRLTVRKITVGKRTMTDIAVCYLKGLAREETVREVSARIESLTVAGLNMGQESLAEVLVDGYWNPFPKIRYTERPDSASAMLMEGSVIVLCDNYPAAMILPTSIFDFLQDTDDFYFPPLIGGYLKAVRTATYLLSLFLTPVWYLLLKNPGWIPPAFDFIRLTDPPTVPLLFQLLLLEFSIDGLKLASLNTPDSLTNSLSVIGGLLIGDFAIHVGWLSEETILYMAFVAIANFTQPSYELGYAFKLTRIVTLILIGFFDFWGLLAGFLLTVLLIVTNPTLAGRGYLYPLIPFNGRAMCRLLFRVRHKRGREVQ